MRSTIDFQATFEATEGIVNFLRRGCHSRASLQGCLLQILLDLARKSLETFEVLHRALCRAADNLMASSSESLCAIQSSLFSRGNQLFLPYHRTQDVYLGRFVWFGTSDQVCSSDSSFLTPCPLVWVCQNPRFTSPSE